MVDAGRGRAQEQAIGSAINDLAHFNPANEPPTDPSVDSHTLLRRALAIYRDRFDAKTWQAFWATVVEGREPAEVAETLGVSRWNIYKARARILQRLRTELAGLVDESTLSDDGG